MMHRVTKKIIWGPPRRAMKILSPSVDRNIMKTSLDEGYLYSLTLRNQKLKCILNYHSFSGPNVCLARLQMELCRAANIFAAC